MIYALLTTLILGLTLLIRGLRGRRIDDHPLCRKCRFDLTRKPQGSTRCPECGADLSNTASKTRHPRRQNRYLIQISHFSLLVVMITAIEPVCTEIRRVNWLHFMPLRYLLQQATSTDAAERTPALAELTKRFFQSRFSGDDWDELEDAGLSYQADLSRPWDSGWGSLLYKFRSFGRVSDLKWHRFLVQGFVGTLRLEVRPVVRRGDPVPFILHKSVGRIAGAGEFSLELSDFQISWNGREVWDAKRVYPSGIPLRLGSYGEVPSQIQSFMYIPNVADGMQTLHVMGRVAIGRSHNEQIRTIVSDHFDISFCFRLNPSNVHSVNMFRDDRLADLIRRALKIYPPHPGAPLVAIDKAPVGLSFSVWIHERNGAEYRVGSFACRASASDQAFALRDWPESAGNTVEVVFRSDPAAAAETIDVTSAWEGEVSIPPVY